MSKQSTNKGFFSSVKQDELRLLHFEEPADIGYADTRQQTESTFRKWASIARVVLSLHIRLSLAQRTMRIIAALLKRHTKIGMGLRSIESSHCWGQDEEVLQDL